MAIWMQPTHISEVVTSTEHQEVRNTINFQSVVHSAATSRMPEKRGVHVRVEHTVLLNKALNFGV